MIDALDVFKVFEKHRGEAIVMASGMSGQHWADISTNSKRDVPIGGAMGCQGPVALGLALSQPDTKVVLFDSEGSLLMNLGVLATIADQKPKNFYHILLDNECYATTGGQPVPSSTEISYHGMAKDAGYPSVHSFEDLEVMPELVEALAAEGLEEPTEFQRTALPVMRRGNNVLGAVGPGAGTLVAYGLALLEGIEIGAGRPGARRTARRCGGSHCTARGSAPGWPTRTRATPPARIRLPPSPCRPCRPPRRC